MIMTKTYTIKIQLKWQHAKLQGKEAGRGDHLHNDEHIESCWQ